MKFRRVVFVCFAVALFIATHWPQLRIPGPQIRGDLIVHVAVFTLWIFLFALAGWLRHNPREWPLTLAIGFAYAALDEGLQAIPILGRTAAWDDFAANCGGIVLGTLAAVVWRKMVERKAVSS